MVRAALHNLHNSIELVIAVGSHDLEGSEQLSRQELALLGRSEVLQGHVDSRGFV